MFGGIYENRNVFLTGHTGFKGSWLAAWLQQLNANIFGFSLDSVSEPDHFSLLALQSSDNRGDIRNFDALQQNLEQSRAEIVFHLAAQPLVRRSYAEPLETFSTNALGTANLLQAVRSVPTVRAAVVITTDKVYENREWDWGYRETDRLGGYDPYAASKACSELVANCFRQSYYEQSGVLLATVRAGNVIGGGDWAEDRLIPDIVRAACRNETTQIRMPQATRPWEHVLEPLAGYLLLGQKLLEGQKEYAEPWNFGPGSDGNISVGRLAESAAKHWDKIHVEIGPAAEKHETTFLRLDCSKSENRLGWKPIWNFEETMLQTIRWYKEYYETGKILTWTQLEKFIYDAQKQGAVWT